MQLADLKDHHFPSWWRQSQSVDVSINTDDAGLFDCSLTSELFELAAAHDLEWDDLLELQRGAIRSSFYPEKMQLQDAFDAAAADIIATARQ